MLHMKWFDICTKAEILPDAYSITANPEKLAARYRETTGKRIRTATVAKAWAEWQEYQRTHPGQLIATIRF